MLTLFHGGRGLGATTDVLQIVPYTIRDHTSLQQTIASAGFQKALLATKQAFAKVPGMYVVTKGLAYENLSPTLKKQVDDAAYLALTGRPPASPFPRDILPFKRFKNALDGKQWGQYVVIGKDTANSYVLTMAIPSPSPGWGLGFGYVIDAVEDIGKGIVWLGEKVVGALKALCDALGDPRVQVTEAAAISGLVAAGFATAGTSAIVGGAIALANGICHAAGQAGLWGKNGAPPITMTAVLMNKYPPGSIARWNTSRNVWVIYGPAGSTPLSGCASCVRSGLGTVPPHDPALPPDPTPPPPAGTVKIAEVPGAQTALPPGPLYGGTERDKHWYTSPLFWASFAVVGGGLGAGAWWWKKRRRA